MFFTPPCLYILRINISTLKPLSHIHDCEHDWTRLFSRVQAYERHMKDVFTIVFSRVQACSGVWKTCSENNRVGFFEHVQKINTTCIAFYGPLTGVWEAYGRRVWPYEGRVRSCSAVWRACSVVFKFGHTTEHVLHTPLIRFNTSPIRFNTPLIRFNTPLIRPPNSVTWYTRARHFVVYI